MPIYEYTAFNSSGKTVAGIVDADSSRSARVKLRHTGIFVTELREYTKSKDTKAGAFFSIPFFKKVKTQDISLMTRQLSTLVGAGLPVVGALTALSEQTENSHLKKIITNVREKINEGSSLADALEEYPKYFSNIFINMIRAGESSGALEIVLLRLAEFLEKQLALRRKIQATLAYPVIMMAIGSLVLFFLLAYVVPIVTRMFAETHAALPLPTIILIAVSGTLQRGWWLIMLSMVLAVFGIKRYSNTEKGIYVMDRIKLNLPVFGNLIRKTAISRFTGTLGILLKSGIPILKSLGIVSAIVDNVIISDAIDTARKNIKEGEDIASPLKMSKLFPPIVIHMIAVGEKSGNLEDMLLKITEAYDSEVESAVQGLTALLEPIMILVMGVVVGFIVLSILLPIFEMNQIIR